MSTSSKTDVDEPRKISIGYISAAHGIKGEVRVVPLTDFPERFAKMPSLDLYSKDSWVRRLHLKRVRGHESKGELIIESDVPNRDEAQKLVGLSILIDQGERVPLPEGNFWVDDLIGLSVRDEQGKLRYIPAVEEFIKYIDLTSGKITVELIEGLWD